VTEPYESIEVDDHVLINFTKEIESIKNRLDVAEPRAAACDRLVKRVVTGAVALVVAIAAGAYKVVDDHGQATGRLQQRLDQLEHEQITQRAEMSSVLVHLFLPAPPAKGP
jgi:cytochrome c-type biogenesis protein CcmH/NrfG